jgi:RNA polymerase sigma-70 factor (ECF subfamily)
LKHHEKEENHTAQSIIVSDLPDHIHKAVANLPPKCRVIFCLSRFEGLSNQEIANELKLSKRTVENQLGNALVKLRQQLKPILSGVIAIGSAFT